MLVGGITKVDQLHVVLVLDGHVLFRRSSRTLVEALALLVVAAHAGKGVSPVKVGGLVAALEDLQQVFNLVVLLIVHEVIAHDIANDPAVHLIAHLVLVPVGIVVVRGLSVVSFNSPNLVLLQEYIIAIFYSVNVLVSEFHYAVVDILLVTLDHGDVLVDILEDLLPREMISVLKFGVFLPLHFLDLVLLGELSKVDLEVVIRRVDNLIILVDVGGLLLEPDGVTELVHTNTHIVSDAGEQGHKRLLKN
jgi:hypothetical protein